MNLPTESSSAADAVSGRHTVGNRRRSPWLAIAVTASALALMATLSGCNSESSHAAAAPSAPAVDVAEVKTHPVTDWNSFTGHFNAIESVQLRPRVSGYIDQVHFEEGSDVHKGDVLFIIDQRPYQLQMERAKADLESARAQRELARIELARSEKLIAVRAVSKEEHDQRASRLSQVEAEYQSAQAALEQAQLDLEYTNVVSPIDGRVSRAEITRGNYVTAGSTVLTTLVSLDPIYVEFESDEHNYNRFRSLIRAGDVPSPSSGETPVFVGLADDDGFPYTAHLDFVDNALNPTTGTIRVRAQIDNPELQFTPGMLARVRLQGSALYDAAVIDGAAIGTDQDRKYVYVVNNEGVVQYRAVELGGVINGKRVVRSGLIAGEKIVVNGLQRVRAGESVQANLVSADDSALSSKSNSKVAYRY